MRENSVARRYALGLIKTLKDEQEYRQAKAELEGFLELLDVNPQFKAGMETLLFSKRQKMELLGAIHQDLGCGEKTFNFLSIMVEENRIILLDLVISALEELWFERSGIEKLMVYSAVPLSERLAQKLAANLEKSFHKKIVIEKRIDESLIAGIKIQRGSIYYDFSIAGNLKKLREAILTETGMNAAARVPAEEQ